MKKIYSSENSQQIAMLQNILQRAGVPVTVVERGSALELMLIQPGYEPIAKEIIREFKSNPPDPAAFMQQRSAHRQQSQSLPLWKILAQQAGIVTFIVFLAVLLTAIMQWFVAPNATISQLIFTPRGVPELSFDQPWRFVTPILLHFSATHLVFNLFWWWYLGGRIELAYNSRILAAVTLITAIVSNYFQWAASGPLFGGLSGVVYGLLGFAMVVAWKKPTHPLALPPFLLIFMVGWLLLGYTDILWVNVANQAHAVGLISGIVLGFFIRLQDGRKNSGSQRF
ncbi:rhomboid family intramembrane serine protease [Aliidiomarina iranensis]|uniref:Rhomboid family intramembrane serine protease n=1 Tax=Aliidiomarina iranensis TaxID=1434071 RepID=A0A432W2D1_9GAMM|nr:rhomboid family intramembrane serine protease [Aliidiomarina iranensis]RUO23392.1 rhomboid family intramembrane serine protease [Aliidiomarina iranensis]